VNIELAVCETEAHPFGLHGQEQRLGDLSLWPFKRNVKGQESGETSWACPPGGHALVQWRRQPDAVRPQHGASNDRP
jgi:hypothetical protein